MQIITPLIAGNSLEPIYSIFFICDEQELDWTISSEAEFIQNVQRLVRWHVHPSGWKRGESIKYTRNKVDVMII